MQKISPVSCLLSPLIYEINHFYSWCIFVIIYSASHSRAISELSQVWYSLSYLLPAKCPFDSNLIGCIVLELIRKALEVLFLFKLRFLIGRASASRALSTLRSFVVPFGVTCSRTYSNILFILIAFRLIYARTSFDFYIIQRLEMSPFLIYMLL